MELIKFNQSLPQHTYRDDTHLHLISKNILDPSLGIQYQVRSTLFKSNYKMYGYNGYLSSHPLFQGLPNPRAQISFEN